MDHHLLVSVVSSNLIGRIVRLSALYPLCPAHTLCTNRVSKQTHYTAVAKRKRAGVRPGTKHALPAQSQISTHTSLDSNSAICPGKQKKVM